MTPKATSPPLQGAAGDAISAAPRAPRVRRLFRKRTSVLILGSVASAVVLALIGLVDVFWLALAVVVIWGLIFSAESPIRQAYLNDMIPSKQRATVLSFDSLLGSSGAVGIQPMLGKVADAWSYPASYVCSGAIQALAIPFLWLARRERADADPMLDAPTRARAAPPPRTGR